MSDIKNDSIRPKMRMPRYSDVIMEEDKFNEAEIIEMRQAGISAIDIAAIQRTSVDSVYRIMRKHKLLDKDLKK